MNNQNKFKTHCIAKRIFESLIILSVVLIILGLFMIWVINNFPGRARLLIDRYDPESIYEFYHFLNTTIPVMIISGITGISIFSPVMLILTYHFKNYQQNKVKIKKEIRLVEDIFRPY